jgi:N-acetylmuramoyl-L-alanine amidase
MQPRVPFARWMPIIRNFTHGGMRTKPIGLAIHITDGVHGQLPNLGGVQATFNHQGGVASTHFCVSKEGVIAQYVALSDTAWGVGGVRGGRNDDSYWISVENIALSGQILTQGQLEGVARLLRYFHEHAEIPLQLANTRLEHGLGYHSMFQRGHPLCPGSGVIAQRDQIITLASGE